MCEHAYKDELGPNTGSEKNLKEEELPTLFNYETV